MRWITKYRLLYGPTLSGWPTLSRRIKVIFVCVIIATLTLLAIVRSLYYFQRNTRLAELYALQTSMIDALDREVKYMHTIQPAADDSWLPIGVPDGNIYSAYLDIRPEIILDYEHANSKKEKTWAVVRIIAVLPLEMVNKPLSCYYKYKTKNDELPIIQRRQATRIRAIDENWLLKYSAFFVLCDLTVPNSARRNFPFNDDTSHLPMAVSLGLASEGNVGRPDKIPFADIHYPKGGIGQLYNARKFLAVCVPVFHHNYDQPLRLIEFVEYYLMMGAEQFTFYNNSISSDVDRVLRYYADRQMATVLQWKLPSYYVFEKTLRVEGIFAALNDCLYRSSFYDNFEYVAAVDIDEFLVPRIHNNFRELMKYLDPVAPGDLRKVHSSFLFRNIFFYNIHDDDNVGKVPDVPYLYTQAKTTRVKEANHPGFRSKYIVRSQDVVELGNHNVWEFRKGFDEIAVDTNVALSHHYRSCEADTIKCYLSPTMVDRTAHKFVRKLGNRVAAACRAIFKDTGCPESKD